MRLRLHGTPTEIVAALPLLRTAFQVADESRPYPDRPPSRLVRVYLDLHPPAAPCVGRDAADNRPEEAPHA